MQRVTAFIDGFNLYYGLLDKGWRRYLWLDIQAFISSILLKNQSLTQVRYYTSIVHSPEDKRLRHQRYLDAISTYPIVEITLGRFYTNQNISKEKMTDVNIAVDMISGAVLDEYDVALLVTGDSDLVPAVKAVNRLRSDKRIVVVFPPKRESYELKQVCHAYKLTREHHFANSVLPDPVITSADLRLNCPDSWK